MNTDHEYVLFAMAYVSVNSSINNSPVYQSFPFWLPYGQLMEPESLSYITNTAT